MMNQEIVGRVEPERSFVERYHVLMIQAGNPVWRDGALQQAAAEFHLIEIPQGAPNQKDSILVIQNNVIGKRILCHIAELARYSVIRITTALRRMEKIGASDRTECAVRDFLRAAHVVTQLINDIGFHVMGREKASHYLLQIDHRMASMWMERLNIMEGK